MNQDTGGPIRTDWRWDQRDTMLQLQQRDAVVLKEKGLDDELWHMLVCGFGRDGG